MKQSLYVRNRTCPLSHNRSVQLNGDVLADSVHGETPPPLVGGISHADAIYTRQIQSEEKGSETRVQMKRPNSFRVLRTSTLELYTSITVVDQGTLSEICQPNHWRFQGGPPGPSSCVYGCNRPGGWDNAACNNVAWSRVCGRLPIPLFHRLSPDVVLMMVVFRLAVYNDREATHGKRCGSALYSASLVCEHSHWLSYLPYTVLCVCIRASLKA